MRYCPNLILYFIQLLLVQSNDDHQSHSYDKLFQSLNSTSISINISQLPSSQAYTRTERPTMLTSILIRSKRKHGLGEFSRLRDQENARKRVDERWRDDQLCSYHKKCEKTSGSEDPTIGVNDIMASIKYIFLINTLLSLCCFMLCHCTGGCDGCNNSTTNDRVNREPSPFCLAVHLEATRRRIENFNLENLQRENLRLGTRLENTMHSTAYQSSGNQLATAYPEQPPSYNDSVVLDLIADAIQRPSLLPPPTYDEFMQRNNERELQKR